MSDLIERDRVLNLLKKHKSGLQGMKGPLSIVEYYIGKLIEKINEMPSAQPDTWMEQNRERILQAGMEGREVEFRIGGRLFAIREKAQ